MIVQELSVKGWESVEIACQDLRDILCGYLKSNVYQHRPQTLEALTDRITNEVAAIPPEMPAKAVRNYHERLNQCFDNEGRHLGDISNPNEIKFPIYK